MIFRSKKTNTKKEVLKFDVGWDVELSTELSRDEDDNSVFMFKYKMPLLKGLPVNKKAFFICELTSKDVYVTAELDLFGTNDETSYLEEYGDGGVIEFEVELTNEEKVSLLSHAMLYAYRPADRFL